jgi:glycosyltransferase involved in cell wall biosynthesis
VPAMLRSPMRVAFIEDGLGGGIGRVIVTLADTMTRRGVSVDVLIQNVARSSFYLAQLPEQASVIRLRTLHRVTGVPSIAAYLLRAKPAAIITPSERLTAIAVRASRLVGSRVKIFATVHNFNTRWFEKEPAADPKYRKEYRRIARYYPECAGVICVSEGLRERFLEESRLAPDVVRTMYNPLITSRVLELAEVPLDHPWFAVHDRLVILGAGRLAPQKDFATLVRAFAALRRDYQLDCRLVIVGEGPLRDDIEKQARALQVQEHVALLGQVGNPYQYMRRADVFALSSIHEALPSVLVEALALGTPLVSTDCPYGPREILEDGKHGELTPTGDHEALAAAIERTRHAPRRPATGAAAARRFDADVVTDQYLAMIGIEKRP